MDFLLIVALAVVAFGPLAIVRGCGFGLGMMGFGFMWPLMFLVPLALLVLIILGLYYMLSDQGKQGSSKRYGESDALRILKERYARGEITPI